MTVSYTHLDVYKRQALAFVMHRNLVNFIHPQDKQFSPMFGVGLTCLRIGFTLSLIHISMMRKIDLIVIHCSATRADRSLTPDDLEMQHRRRGFNG